MADGVVTTDDEAYDPFDEVYNAQRGVGTFAGDGGVFEATESAGSIGACFPLLWRLLQLMCEGHKIQMQRLMHVQPEARHSHDLIKEACLVCNLLCSDSIVMAQMICHAEVSLLGFVLGFLIETVQGPCPEAQLAIAKSGVLSAIALLLSTNLTAAGEFSQLKAENRIVLPPPLPAQDHRRRRSGSRSGHGSKHGLRDRGQPDHPQHMGEKGDRGELGQYVYQYVGKPVKNVKQEAITLLLGLLEGRADSQVHSLIIAALDAGCIRRYLSCIFATQLALQSLATRPSELKCEEAIVEHFLRRQGQGTKSADPVFDKDFSKWPDGHQQQLLLHLTTFGGWRPHTSLERAASLVAEAKGSIARGERITTSPLPLRSIQLQIMNHDGSEEEWYSEFARDGCDLLALVESLRTRSPTYSYSQAWATTVKPGRLVHLRKQHTIQRKFEKIRCVYEQIAKQEDDMDVGSEGQEGAVRYSRAVETCCEFLALVGLRGGSSVKNNKHRDDDDDDDDDRGVVWQELYITCCDVYEKHLFSQAYKSLSANVKSVEVLWNGVLEKHFFAVPMLVKEGLDKQMKTRVLQDLDLNTPEDKAKDVMRSFEQVIMQMRQFDKLRSYWLVRNRFFDLLKGDNVVGTAKVAFVVAVLVNLIVLVTLTNDNSGGEEIMTNNSTLTSVKDSLGVILALLSLVLFLVNLLKRAPLTVAHHWEAYGAHLSGFGSPFDVIGNELKTSFASTVSKLCRVLGQEMRHASKDFHLLVKLVLMPVLASSAGCVIAACIVYWQSAHLNASNPSAGNGYEWIFPLTLAPILPAFLTRLRRWVLINGVPETPISLIYVCAYDCLFDKLTLFRTAHLVCTLLGVFVADYFFIVPLFEVVVMYPTLTDVVLAVYVPVHQLGLTAVLALIVLYAFTLVAFFFFRDSFVVSDPAADPADDYNHCETLARCYFFIVHMGLLMGGGIGEYLSLLVDHPYTLERGWVSVERVLFDVAFFVTITIGLLNIVFGIMVDTFSQLREQQQRRTSTITNSCLICDITRADFSKGVNRLGAFERHISDEHNLFSYLAFIAHMKLKDETEYNGVESYVSKCVQKGNISWLPNHMALSLVSTLPDGGQSSEAGGVLAEDGHINGVVSAAGAAGGKGGMIAGSGNGIVGKQRGMNVEEASMAAMSREMSELKKELSEMRKLLLQKEQGGNDTSSQTTIPTAV
jgi:hypothetical protein